MKFSITAAMLAAAVAVATPALARELRIAPGAPPAHPANGYLYQGLQQFLAEESGGAITATILGPEVVSLTQMRDALTTGLLDMGNLLPLYYPAELPNFALAGELSLSGTNPQAVAAALTEYTVNCDSCQAEMLGLGIVYLGSGSSDPYVLLTKTPVRTAADLSGLRLRSGGAPFSRWAENFGAVPVSIGVGETFEAMSQGTIDGSIASVADLLSFRLIDLAKYVTVVPLGTYFSTSNFATSAQTWADMSVEERGAVVRAANRANTHFTNRWGYDMPTEARAAATAAGIEILEADPAFAEASAAFAVADRDTAVAVSVERFGMADAADRVAEFLALKTKWEGIAEEVGNDPVAMADRIYAEVWSKVDLATYGQ
jgi:TRAP-type C4-dicarboxylate transport system substrate-binding protein